MNKTNTSATLGRLAKGTSTLFLRLIVKMVSGLLIVSMALLTTSAILLLTPLLLIRFYAKRAIQATTGASIGTGGFVESQTAIMRASSMMRGSSQTPTGNSENAFGFLKGALDSMDSTFERTHGKILSSMGSKPIPVEEPDHRKHQGL